MEKQTTKQSANKKNIIDTVDKSVDTLANQLQRLEQNLDSAVVPVRERVFSRFPILFVLATTFGVASVFYGFERLISEIQFLYDRPLLILSLGVVILLATGTLYKMLDRSR